MKKLDLRHGELLKSRKFVEELHKNFEFGNLAKLMMREEVAEPDSERKDIPSESDIAKILNSIEENINEGVEGNAVVDLIQHNVVWEGDTYPVEGSWIRAINFEEKSSECLHLNNDDILNALVYIGGQKEGEKYAIIIQKFDNGKIIMNELAEGYFLFFSRKQSKEVEVGILLSFQKGLNLLDVAVIKASPSLAAVVLLLKAGTIEITNGESFVAGKLKPSAVIEENNNG